MTDERSPESTDRASTDENSLPLPSASALSRRHVLAASTAALASLAGCLSGDDGDDTADAGEDDEENDDGPDPVDPDEAPGPGSVTVEDPPEAVYLPSHREDFEFLPMETVGEYRVMPHFTYPHSFWLMRGEETEEVEPNPDELHFMVAYWDSETGQMLPVDPGATMEVRQDGDVVEPRFNPWPMISQGMGFHFGDNVPLEGEGTYEIELQLGSLDVRKTGEFEGRFEETATETLEFEYTMETLQRLVNGVEFLDEERWGEPGAIELQGHDHGDHDGHDGGDDGHGDGDDGHDDDHDGGEHSDDHDGHDHPEMALPPADAYPGEDLGVHESGDADFVVRYFEEHRLGDGGGYLFVSPRTPYNRIPLPDMALAVEGEIEGGLVQTLDSELGHHYGLQVDIEAAAEFDLVVESPPQVSRHQGYETAFIDMPPMSIQR